MKMFKKNIRNSLKPFINFQWKIHENSSEKAVIKMEKKRERKIKTFECQHSSEINNFILLNTAKETTTNEFSLCTQQQAYQ